MTEHRITKIAPMGSDATGQTVGFGFIDDDGHTHRFQCQTRAFGRIILEFQRQYRIATEKWPETGDHETRLVNPATVKRAQIGPDLQNNAAIVTFLLDSGLELGLSLPLELSFEISRGLAETNQSLASLPQSRQ